MVGQRKLYNALLPKDQERFWSRVDRSGDCWLWTGSLFNSGYGRFKAERQDRCAHAWSYELMRSPVPLGLELDHLCRVRRCVNPAHLEPVTPQTNLLRGLGLASANSQKTHCVNGHEFSSENTGRASNGGRVCRRCAVICTTRLHLKKGAIRTTKVAI